jgi:hypothetical protein
MVNLARQKSETHTRVFWWEKKKRSGRGEEKESRGEAGEDENK